MFEGVMMRGVDKVSMAVRLPDGGIDTEIFKARSVRETNALLRLPFVRGIVSFIESIRLSYKCLYKSMAKAGIEDAPAESRFEKWLVRVFGEKLMSVVITIGMVLGVGLSIFLFLLVPTAISRGIDLLIPLGMWKAGVEGAIKIILFVAYIGVAYSLPEMRRITQYHGAEHKTIACYEKGLDLTIENTRSMSPYHPRCGTSFILIVLIISIILFLGVSVNNVFARIGLKLLMLPLVMGITFELIKLAGRYDNWFTRILSAPGMWLQRITAKEPEDGMLEVAITSMEGVITGNPKDDAW